MSQDLLSFRSKLLYNLSRPNMHRLCKSPRRHLRDLLLKCPEDMLGSVVFSRLNAAYAFNRGPSVYFKQLR